MTETKKKATLMFELENPPKNEWSNALHPDTYNKIMVQKMKEMMDSIANWLIPSQLS